MYPILQLACRRLQCGGVRDECHWIVVLYFSVELLIIIMYGWLGSSKYGDICPALKQEGRGKYCMPRKEVFVCWYQVDGIQLYPLSFYILYI